MSRKDKMVIVVLSALLLSLMAGCSDDSTAPQEVLPPSLDSGYSSASWAIEGTPCQDGQFCLSSLLVHQSPGREPQIRVQVTGDWGSRSQSAVVSSDDFNAYTDLVGAVIESRQRQHEGCQPMEAQRETVDTFAGDAGWSASIEGCDEPIVEELRNLNLQLVAKYFPVD